MLLRSAPCVMAVWGTVTLAGTTFIGSFSGGGHAGSANYSLDSSMGAIGGSATTGSVSLATGGPTPVLATNLEVMVVPSTINEGSTGQLSGIAKLDDRTVTVLGGGDIGWGAVAYPFGSVNTAGVLTAANVYANTNGLVTAVYLGASTNLRVTVLDSNPDNYGIYAGDQVPDGWQVVFFGNNNPLGTASATNSTGRNNLYSYTADLNPTNPSSVFGIVATSSQPPKRIIYFGTTSTARLYRLLYATNLTSGAWTNVPGQSPSNGLAGQMSLFETNVSEVRFYRVDVQVP